MVGPSPAHISELEIGDTVKVVSEDGSFEARIEDASAEEGITFVTLRGDLPYVIAIDDLPEYDLYPRGDTIKKISDKRKAQEDARDPNAWKRESFAEKEQLLKESKAKERPEIDENTIKFFELFEKFQNTSLGDQHRAEILMDAMEELAGGKEDLQEALLFAIQERIKFLKEAEMT